MTLFQKSCIFILWMAYSKLDRVKTMGTCGKINAI